MLTRKQHELLLFINRHLSDHGVSPSFDEMKDALGLRSKSGIHRLIRGLEERSFIRRLPHRARALEVLRLPESASRQSGSLPGAADEAPPPHHGPPHHGQPFSPRVIQGDFRTALPGTNITEAVGSAVQLPLYGKIAAGTPIEALRDNNSFAEVPGSLVGRGEHYALQVEGDSMIDAGIFDGDTVIIRKTDLANNGDIVVAFIDDTEVTLKRFRRKGESIALEPANKSYETRIFGPQRVKIQGILAGLMRTY